MNTDYQQDLAEQETAVKIQTKAAWIWQAELIAAALEANEIDESQAILLATLYFRANWRTRVLSDFRAERACQWLGHETAYTRSMQKRLQELREMGWFTWTYKNGVKTPYDITMCANGECVRHRHPVTPDNISLNTLSVKNESSGTRETTPLATQFVTVTPRRSPHDGGAHPCPEASNLRARIYRATNGELLDRILNPSQILDLLHRHSVEIIEYAIERRFDKIRDIREFHRSFRPFLLDGGIQIELDTAQAELRDHFERANGWHSVGVVKGVHISETPVQRLERIARMVKTRLHEIKLFPNLIISGDVGDILTQQRSSFGVKFQEKEYATTEKVR